MTAELTSYITYDTKQLLANKKTRFKKRLPNLPGDGFAISILYRAVQ